MTTPKEKFSIIMPAYNEEDYILNSIETASQFLETIGYDYEIIVVDDGSSDATRQRADKARLAANRLKIVHYDINVGKGHALKYGFQYATGDLIVFLDADLDLPPEQIQTLYEAMRRSRAEVVVGSKRHPESRLNYPWHRKVMSDIYYILIRMLCGLPVKDTQTGIKLFSRRVLEQVLPRLLVKNYALDLELLVNAHRLGYRITEAPITLTFQRPFSRLHWRDIRNILMDTMAIFYRTYILGYYDRPIVRPLPPSSNQLTPLTTTPPVSIVIAAKEPNPYLDKCLAYCAQLDYPDFEILIVPDYPFETKGEKVTVIPTGPLPPGQKRDLATAHAKGEIIAYLDDDTFPDKMYLRNAIKYFRDETVGAVGGPAITPPDDGLMQKASGLVYSSPLCGGNLAFRYIPKKRKDVDDFPTCNLLVRKDVFLAAGGFNTRFWPGEDTKLCLTITKELGKRIVYAPEVVVWHHRRALFAPHLRQILSYSLHRGYFARRFPQTSRKLLYFIPTLFDLGLVVGLFLALFSPTLKAIYLGSLAIYLAVIVINGLAIGLSTRDPRLALAVASGIIITHILYGINFARGLLSRWLKEERMGE
ncbi:MAG: glycosyltransferase [Chloroflexi bacterium]|nr:glycosyltransferase [Chloroflexota bacterium]